MARPPATWLDRWPVLILALALATCAALLGRVREATPAPATAPAGPGLPSLCDGARALAAQLARPTESSLRGSPNARGSRGAVTARRGGERFEGEDAPKLAGTPAWLPTAARPIRIARRGPLADPTPYQRSNPQAAPARHFATTRGARGPPSPGFEI